MYIYIYTYVCIHIPVHMHIHIHIHVRILYVFIDIFVCCESQHGTYHDIHLWPGGYRCRDLHHPGASEGRDLASGKLTISDWYIEFIVL